MIGRLARAAWRNRAWTLIALVTGASGWPALEVRAAESVTLEHRVKAAFLYKIAGYVEWPAKAFREKGTPLAIGVLGAEPLTEELARIVGGRSAQGRPITVRPMGPRDSLDGLHLLFVAREHSDRLETIVPGAVQRSVLVVTEWDGALTQGSMVNFIIVDDRVRFEIGLGAARRAGLTFSSRLLAVAQRVDPEER